MATIMAATAPAAAQDLIVMRRAIATPRPRATPTPTPTPTTPWTCGSYVEGRNLYFGSGVNVQAVTTIIDLPGSTHTQRLAAATARCESATAPNATYNRLAYCRTYEPSATRIQVYEVWNNGGQMSFTQDPQAGFSYASCAKN